MIEPEQRYLKQILVQDEKKANSIFVNLNKDNFTKVAITKAFLATESGNAAASERIHKKVNQLTENVVEVFQRRMPSGGTLHIEEIQDQVELQLMRSEELDVAKSYILYRAERTQERKKEKLDKRTRTW